MQNAITPAIKTISPRLNRPLSKKYCCVDAPRKRPAMIHSVPMSKKIVEVPNFFFPCRVRLTSKTTMTTINNNNMTAAADSSAIPKSMFETSATSQDCKCFVYKKIPALRLWL
jgi:hypothetical protein